MRKSARDSQSAPLSAAGPYAVAAPEYLAGGFSPFILPAGQKKSPPTGFTGGNGKRVTKRDVERWARETPGGNVGLWLFPGLIGLDVDAYKGEAERDAWLALLEKNGPLPEGPCSTSRDDELSGIRLFRVPADYIAVGVFGHNGQSAGETIQPHHRYVVAPPSIHPTTGNPYRWRAGGYPSLPDVPWLPEAWQRDLEKGNSAAHRVSHAGGNSSGYQGLSMTRPQDERLRDLAWKFACNGATEEEAYTAWREFADSMALTDTSWPWTREDFDRHWLRAVERAPEPVKAAGPDFWNERPALAIIRDFARSRRLAPAAVLGAVLAAAIADTNHGVVLPGVGNSCASLNFFVALVGKSGAGKSQAISAVADLLPIQAEVCALGSGEGIAYLFGKGGKEGVTRTSYAALAKVEEIDTLAALGGRKGATLLPELRKAWSGEPIGFQYADPSKRIPIPAHSYRLCLVVGVQPGHAEFLTNDITAGTPQRFVWLPATDRDAPDVAPDEPGPLVLPPVNWPANPYQPETGLRHRMTVCDLARGQMDADRLARARGEDTNDMDSHALLLRFKVAAGLAIISSPEPTHIGETDWRLAGELMALSDSVRAEVIAAGWREAAAANRAAGKHEAIREISKTETVSDHQARAVERVADLVARRLGNNGPATKKELKSVVASRDRWLLGDALDLLKEDGRVKVNQNERYESLEISGGTLGGDCPPPARGK